MLLCFYTADWFWLDCDRCFQATNLYITNVFIVQDISYVLIVYTVTLFVWNKLI